MYKAFLAAVAINNSAAKRHHNLLNNTPSNANLLRQHLVKLTSQYSQLELAKSRFNILFALKCYGILTFGELQWLATVAHSQLHSTTIKFQPPTLDALGLFYFVLVAITVCIPNNLCWLVTAV